MSMGENLSPADIVALTGNNRNDSGFGGENGAWWIIIFVLFFAFGGWGNGFGNRGGVGTSGSGAMDNYVLASDFATLQRQIDSGVSSLERKSDAINNGLCDGLYAQAQLINGVNSNIASTTASVQQTLCQGFNGVNSAINTSGYETRNAINGVSSQLADCCCKTQSSIKDINFNIAMQTNSINQTLCNGFRDVIDSQNANYRALHDEIVANRIEDKNAQITAQQNQINALQLAASQQAQNNYLVNQLRPCPVPAYTVQNPYCCGYGSAACNNNCCGCC